MSKTNTVNLWTNKYAKSEAAPGFTSVELQLAEVPGKRFQVALWGPKRDRNGNTFYTVNVKEFVPRENWKAPSRTEDPPPPPPPAQQQGYTHSGGYVGGDDDDTPF